MHDFKRILIVIGFVLFTTVALQSSYFSNENLNIGDVADDTIYSPKTHRYLDEDATQKMQEEALNKVQVVYNENSEVFTSIEKDFNSFIDGIITYKEKKSNLDLQLSELNKNSSFSYDEELESYYKGILNPFEFEKEHVLTFTTLDKNELDKIKNALLSYLDEIFSEKVTHENIDSIVLDFNEYDLFYYYFDKEVSSALISKISNRIQPNFTLDEEATELKKVEAVESVDAVFKEIKKGEIVVRIGEVVSLEQYNKLKELGLVSGEFSILTMISKLPYFAMIFAVIYIFINHFYKKEFSNIKSFVFLFATISVTAITTDAITDSYFSSIPLLTSLMIFAVFWGRRFVMFSSITIGLLISNGEFLFLTISLLSGLIISITFKNIDKRMNVIIIGLTLGFILSIADIIIYYSYDVGLNLSSHFGLLVCGCVAAILTVGLIPVVENFLGTITSLKLYELSDPNHPLLKRLLTEALGTYTHSLMVANLSEVAGDKIGADGMKLRVAAYFHDVGKLKNPEYFIENSTPENNPHQFIDEATSASIIREHPIDSIKMCKEYKIPSEILDIIERHHGDSVLKHLYNQAKEKSKKVSIDDFRYLTPKPKTKEDGILLLADSTEAYSRVIKHEPQDIMEKKIRELILSKVQSGILSECELTLKDIDDIADSFVTLLVYSNHERIAYSK